MAAKPTAVTDTNVQVKTLRHVVAIKACGEHCVIVAKTEENVYQLHLCYDGRRKHDKIKIYLAS